MPEKRLRVGVLFGGRSAEHEVSLRSALSIMEAMDRDKYELVPIGVSKAGEWRRLDAGALEGPANTLALQGDRVALLPHPEDQSLVPLDNGAEGGAGVSQKPLDVVFPVLHGPLGEDGTVQGLFELADIPYVGSGVLGSAVGMDKATMKALFLQRQLNIPRHRVFLRKRLAGRRPRAVRTECEAAFAYPWFVKPANLGSSVGISKVHNAGRVRPGHGRSGPVRPQAGGGSGGRVHAREVEVAVMGNDEPLASVVGEILPSHEFYDYESKYLDEATRLIIPADLPETVANRVRGDGGGGISGAGLRGTRAGGLFDRCEDPGSLSIRGQYHARIHLRQHVSEALGGIRDPLRRTHRQAHRAGSGAPRGNTRQSQKLTD